MTRTTSGNIVAALEEMLMLGMTISFEGGAHSSYEVAVYHGMGGQQDPRQHAHYAGITLVEAMNRAYRTELS